MSSKKKTLDAHHKAVLIWTAVAIVLTLLVAGGGVASAAWYGSAYEGKIFPGVYVLDVPLGGLTPDEARTTLHHAVDEALKDGLRFQVMMKDGQVRPIALPVTTAATGDPDASRDLIQYELEPALMAAAGYGRGNNILFDTLMRVGSRIRPVRLSAVVHLDDATITSGLLQAVDGNLPERRDATLHVTWNDADNTSNVQLIPEQSGRGINTEDALRALHLQAEQLRFDPISLRIEEQEPTIRTADVKPLEAAVPMLLTHAPFRLQYEDHNLLVSTSTLAGWLGVVRENGKPTLTIDPDLFAAGVRELAPGIEKVAKQGSFVIEDGKINGFEAGTEGLVIDDVATRGRLLAAWSRGELPAIFPLIVTKTEAALTGQDPERLGIKEIIGIGRSNFSGSPANRRKNIAIGVGKVNGSLIPPGEEFSLLKTLGPIEASEGWLPELVIKGNETVPELGGGLCQIGTTTFRAALASGLPIVKRQNHSYRVSYYEPAGTDATIYDPAPDFRFLNDTGHYVLIHAYTQGNEVIYEFWGTEDNRQTLFKGQQDVAVVDDLKPRIYNVASPPPTKLIETLDLPPGKKRCTESAHAGADAVFDYEVTYPDGTVKEETFRSHYRPWQAVCLVGVEKLSEPEGEGTDDALSNPDLVENAAVAE